MRYRSFLFVLGAIYLALGIAVLVNPEGSAEAVSLTPEATAGRLEFYAVYAGLELGLGIWWLWSAGRLARVTQGLQLAAVLHVGLSVTRLIGLVRWPTLDVWTVLALATEALVAILALSLLAAWRREQARPATLASR